MKQTVSTMFLILAACVSLVADEAASIQDKKEINMSTTTIVISTSMGDVTVELNAEKSPLTVSNFLAYVDSEFYNGTIFHRVMDGFMIQGGGFTRDMQPKPTRAPIKNEAANGLSNQRGTIAMARTMVVDSATAQFFINHADNAFLDHTAPTSQGFGYAVFGKVTDGMDVVDKIAKVPTTTRAGHQNVPETPVIITKIVRQGDAE